MRLITVFCVVVAIFVVFVKIAVREAGAAVIPIQCGLKTIVGFANTMGKIIVDDASHNHEIEIPRNGSDRGFVTDYSGYRSSFVRDHRKVNCMSVFSEFLVPFRSGIRARLFIPNILQSIVVIIGKHCRQRGGYIRCGCGTGICYSEEIGDFERLGRQRKGLSILKFERGDRYPRTLTGSKGFVLQICNVSQDGSEDDEETVENVLSAEAGFAFHVMSLIVSLACRLLCLPPM